MFLYCHCEGFARIAKRFVAIYVFWIASVASLPRNDGFGVDCFVALALLVRLVMTMRSTFDSPCNDGVFALSLRDFATAKSKQSILAIRKSKAIRLPLTNSAWIASLFSRTLKLPRNDENFSNL